MHCPYCGRNSERAGYCTYCGRDLRNLPSQQPVAPRQQSSPNQLPPLGYPTSSPRQQPPPQQPRQVPPPPQQPRRVRQEVPVPPPIPAAPEAPAPFPPHTLEHLHALESGAQPFTILDTTTDGKRKKTVRIVYPRCVAWQQVATLLKAFKEQQEAPFETFLIQGYWPQDPGGFTFTNGQLIYDRAVRLGGQINNRYQIETGNGFEVEFCAYCPLRVARKQYAGCRTHSQETRWPDPQYRRDKLVYH